MTGRAAGWLLALLLSVGPAWAQQHVNQRKGFNAENTYQLLGLDNVNLFNGNLTLAIPLGQSYEVASGLSYGFQLVCNGNAWDSEVAEGLHRDYPNEQPTGATPIMALPDRRSNAGIGCMVTLGRLIPPQSVTNNTARWIYESPDGAEHYFHPTLKEGSQDTDAHFYTRDSSYLRLRAVGTSRFVDFPDGTVREFELDPDSLIEAWRLVAIRNQYPANFVAVDYATGPDVWEISDSLGRVHRIRFDDVHVDGTYVPMVESVELDAFGTTSPAVYAFTYSRTETINGVPPPTIDRPTWDTDAVNTGTPDDVVLPLLKTLTLPDGTKFKMDYREISFDGGDSGLLARLRLPTEGCIAWDWGTYAKPDDSGAYPHVRGSLGVVKRVLSDRGCPDPVMDVEDLRDVAVGVWTYEPDLTYEEEPSEGIPLEMTNKVVDPLGNYVVHYFSAHAGSPRQGFLSVDYGLPFTRKVTADGKLLSRRTYAAGGTSLRSEFVTYERDGSHLGMLAEDPSNVRVTSTRVRYDDDGDRYVDTEYDDYDGYGHFETVTTDGGTFTPGLLRTVTTDYTPRTDDLWLLGLAQSSKTVEGDTTLKTEFCFHPTHGHLSRKRSIASLAGTRGATDVITVFENDPQTGNLQTETWYGGDGGSVSTTSSWCSESLSGPVTRLNYKLNFMVQGDRKSTVEYANPPSSTTAGIGYLSSDVTLDSHTGLVSSSRDTAGIQTSYTYDALGRPVDEKPVGRAWTLYGYTPAAATGPKVTVRQYANGSLTGTPLTTAGFEFDDLGRLVKSTRVMPQTPSPDDTEVSEQTFTYNAMGWKTFVTEPGVPGSTVGTSYTYDAFGRPKSVETADGAEVTYDYTGGREVRRKSFVATSAAAAQQIETTERFDAIGRLVEVVEKSGPTSAGSPIGADVKTAYRYDPASRLVAVRMTGADGIVQNRAFDYDGRGFLRWEAHPESGITAYTHDARGKVTSKIQSEAGSLYDLLYEYDAAERLLFVDGRNPNNPLLFRTMKAFEYGTANATQPADWRKGKLVRAVRYNYPRYTGETYEVADTYAYTDAAGRKTDRTTTITIPGFLPQTLQTITTSFAYNDLDLPSEIRYPMCVYCGVPQGRSPDRSLQPTYDQGRVKTIPDFVSSVTYWPNGMWKEIVHTNGMVDSQTLDNGMARPQSLSAGSYDTCTPPVILSQPGGATISSGTPTALLSVSVQSGSAVAYQWYSIGPNGVAVLMQGETAAAVTVSPSTTTSYYVEVTNACRTVTSRTAVVAQNTCSQPSLGALDAARNSDGTWTLAPESLSVRNPSTYVWRRTSDNAVVGSAESITIVVTQTSTYQLTVTDSCGSASASKTIQVPLPMTVSGLTATRTTANKVEVVWPPSAGAAQYEVYRGGQMIATTPSTTYLDQSVVANTTYVYRVRALDANGQSASAFSNADVATTKVFTPAVSGDVITADLFNQMLAAVNSVRAAAGWRAVTWNNVLAETDPVPAPGLELRTIYVTACRARMDEALQALGARVMPYTDPDPTLALMKAVYVNELFGRTQ